VVPLAPTPNYYAGNFQPGQGNFHEYEASTEINVPLINDPQFGKADLDIAGRETVYSTSGWVSTWKVGVTWDTPLEGVRFRALQSRDVRAPNLAELYGAPRVNNGSVTDDFSVNGGPVNQSVSPLPNPIVGNPNLKPERGATTELGLVYSPDWLPGFNASATYYRIGVKGEVSNFSQQQQMDACYNGGNPGATAGSLAQCAFFYSIVGGVAQSWVQGGVLTNLPTTTTPNGQITQLFNVASVVTDGVDYEMSYRFALDDALDWGMGGDITLRALATNVSKFITNPGISGVPIIETAGANAASVPHWKMFFTEAYDTDNWGIFFNERWFSDGVINKNWVACTPGSCPVPVDANHPTVNSNFMPGEFYLDIGGRFNLTPMTQLWFKVDNALNQSPDNAYSYNPANQSPALQPTLYDVLGRFYHVGVRLTY
jgi:outer membrane receptor protein involved in Fe transport